MLPSNPELKILQRQAEQIEIQLFDPRDLPQWPEWIEWWHREYGTRMTFDQVVYHAPELKHRPTYAKYFPGIKHRKPVPTEQFLVYRLRKRYASDTDCIRPVGHRPYSRFPETETARSG